MTCFLDVDASTDEMSRIGSRLNGEVVQVRGRNDLGAAKGGPMRTIDAVVSRLRAEFLEMPGLRLRPAQIQRLCDLEPATCEKVLEALVRARFLRVTADGHYARLTDGQSADGLRAASSASTPEQVVGAAA